MTPRRVTSRQNPVLQRLRRLNASPAFRRREGVFAGEGPKLLEEALKWGAPLETVISAPGTRLPAFSCKEWVEVPEDILTWAADTDSPQGVIFTCGLPDTALPERLTGERYLVLDGIQDPGNLGSIWRTADAFGAAGLLLTGACADPFGPKTVRATMGACFRLPVWRGGLEELRGLLEKSGLPLYATALRPDAQDARQADLSHAAVVIGSEGRGISAELLSLCEKALKLPMTGRCESLNAAAAAAVILWEGWR